jgi:hypothetical protein
MFYEEHGVKFRGIFVLLTHLFQKTESKSKEKVPEKTTKDEQKEVEKEDKKNSKVVVSYNLFII